MAVSERGFWPLRFRHRLLVFCAVISVGTLLVVFFYLQRKQEAMHLQHMRHEARLLVDQIVLTRKWIADHGGIFVEKMPWVTPNPFLEKPTFEAGEKKYVRENPAMVTRQLADYARDQGSYWFNITSLEPINPSNKPDDFEREALTGFEEGESVEAEEVSTIQEQRFYRYIAPLYVEEGCLNCHARHGYDLGDIRGGISVTIPMEEFYAMLAGEWRVVASFALLVSFAVTAFLYLSVNRGILQPISRLRDFVVRWRRETRDGSAGSPGSGAFCADPGSGVTGAMEGVAPGDELHDLYREFCRLHEIITGHQRELEERVEEATGELSKVNDQLVLARDRYRRISERKSEFISSISHELRTPLTSIKGAVRYLAERLEDGSGEEIPPRGELAPFIEIISRNMDHFVKFVEDTLDLEKIESGKVDYHVSRIDLANLIRESIRDQGAADGGKSVGIAYVGPRDLLLQADEDRIRQVLSNLLQNAVRFSPPTGAVTVECLREKETVKVSVSDQGPGLTEEECTAVFERFHKGQEGGSGLGLTIAKGIIEAHGGEIGVESDGSSGSTFTFRLPVNGELLKEGVL
jgi:signal transduction histidine kinase